jgi:hypothetical protein
MLSSSLQSIQAAAPFKTGMYAPVGTKRRICALCRVRESVDITRLSHIVRGHMQGGERESALTTFASAHASSADVKLDNADAELVFHDQELAGLLLLT